MRQAQASPPTRSKCPFNQIYDDEIPQIQPLFSSTELLPFHRIDPMSVGIHSSPTSLQRTVLQERWTKLVRKPGWVLHIKQIHRQAERRVKERKSH